MPSFQDLPRELQSTILSLLPSSRLHSLARLDLPDHLDFLEVIREDFRALERARDPGARDLARGSVSGFGDLARAALVCRQWRCMAEDPLLWRDFVLCVDYWSNLDLLPGMERFSAARSLVVRGGSDAQLSLLAQQLTDRIDTGKLENLENLVILHRPRTPSFLGFVQAAPLIKNFIIGDLCNLDDVLSDALFAELARAIDEGRSILQSLRVCGFSLSSIPPVQMAKVVAGLRKAVICWNFLEKNQVAALMTALLETSKLEVLDIGLSDLSQVEPKTLAKVVHGIKTVVLTVSETQLVEILKMCTGDTKLQYLCIFDGRRVLKDVDRALLDEAKKKVEIDVEETLSSSESDDEENDNDEELMVVEDNEELEPNQQYEEVVDQEDEELEVNSKQDEKLEMHIKEDE